jgi:hypothetical protein
MPKRMKRRTVRQRRLSRLKAIANRLIASKDAASLSKLSDWMRDHEFEAEADLLKRKAKELA